jgi:hypothetical protein
MKRTVHWIWAAGYVAMLLGCVTGGGKGCDAGDSRSGFADVYNEDYYIKLEPVASSQIQDGRLILRGEMDQDTVEKVKTFFDRAKEVDPNAEIYCLEATFSLVHEEHLGKKIRRQEPIDDWNDYFCGEVRVYVEKKSDGSVECYANNLNGYHIHENGYVFNFQNSSVYGFADGDPRKVRPHLLNGDASFFVEASTAMAPDSDVQASLYLVYRLNLAQYASRCVFRTAPCEEEGAPAQTPLCGPYAAPDMSEDMSQDMTVDMGASDLGMSEDMQPEDQGADQQMEQDQAQDLDDMAEEMASDASTDAD